MNHVLCTCSSVVVLNRNLCRLSLHFQYVRVFSKESKTLLNFSLNTRTVYDSYYPIERDEKTRTLFNTPMGFPSAFW